jgi:nucleotidyltransferase/DNA polymerase involved in DNA repair
MTHNNTTTTFERAIIHINSTSLFASIEQLKHKQYKGKPLVVVTTKGVFLSVSVEAKKCGVAMTMSFKEMKKLFPEVIIVMRESKGYTPYTKKIDQILKRYTQDVEIENICGCFADVTGLRTLLKMTYKEIGESIIFDIKKDLGVYLPTALATSKVLAHLGSKDAPLRTLCVVNGRNSSKVLKNSFVEDIWNITSETIAYLNKLRIYSAYDLMKLPSTTVEKVFQKPVVELWNELRGVSMWHDLALIENDIDYNLSLVRSYHQNGYSKNNAVPSLGLAERFEKLRSRILHGSPVPLALQTFEERLKRHLIIPYIGKVS